jgi:hypothetical protein
MYEWLDDYSDTSKVCWASDSKMVVTECWCAQCQEAMKLLPLYELANSNAEIGVGLEIQLAQAKADFAGAMGSVIVAEAVAKEEVEKRKTLEDQLVKCQQIKDDNEGMAETWMRSTDRAEKKLAEAKTYIERGIENGDITEDELDEPFWTDLFDLLDIVTTEEVEVIIDIRVLATVTKPRNADLVSYDFDLDSIDISANEDGYEIEISESEITDVNEA